MKKSEGEKNGKDSNARNVSVWSESTEKSKRDSGERWNRESGKSESAPSAASERKEKGMRMN